uniref:Uncharacterized protein n=1 Tax=Anguilla anguilla TaxID=7936 RepID=A0A0E9SW94_ANGAN
MRFVLLFHHC